MPNHCNWSRCVPLVCLTHDVIELRSRAICTLWRPPTRMASNYDVFSVPTSLKYNWTWEAVADAISLSAERTTKHHILGKIDSDQPIRSIKDFVTNEPETSN